jgi:hypothetical protein
MRYAEAIRDPGPALALRAARELEGQGQADLGELRARILSMRRVREIFLALDAARDGDLLFHGYGSVEAFAKALVEHGLEPGEPHLARCLGLLSESKEGSAFLERGLSKAGTILEGEGCSGAMTIRAAALAHAGILDDSDIPVRIEVSLAAFRAAAKAASIDEIAVSRRGKLTFRPGALWPDYYNLRVLAFTKSWRTGDNLAMLAQAFRAMARLSPIPPIYLYWKGRMIAPGSYLMHDPGARAGASSGERSGEWLLRAECLARAGVLARLPLRGDAKALIENDDLRKDFSRGLRAGSISAGWGSYTGFSLEEDWRTQRRKTNDILFRLALMDRLCAS